MALTQLQRALCRLIAENRIASGESYIGGGSALNELIGAPRLSADVDLFHDTEQALAATWEADRRLIEGDGFALRVVRERPSFIEAEVTRAGEGCLLQWVRDSAYRFFPLVEHRDLGVCLHPFDLATNKLLALIGRVEVRDWIDAIECHDRVQPLGYLAWAACGKDPGFNPVSILEHAAATTRYSAAEVAELSFAGPPPDAGALSRRWREILASARVVVAGLPAEKVGRAVLTLTGELCRASADELPALLARGEIHFHEGRIRGALPQLSGA
jgi:hypothetical protein